MATERIAATRSLFSTGFDHLILDNRFVSQKNHLSIGTMHLAKGLEFRAVAVTRARDHLLITAVKPESEFLYDMNF